MRFYLLALLFAVGCSSTRGKNDGGLQFDYDAGSDDMPPQTGCEGQPVGCYTVYAHGDHMLYSIDLMTKQLVVVGPFKAPMVVSGTRMVEDVITDLAVAPDGTIYAISISTLYTVSPVDGHVTTVGALSACGGVVVALTALPDGSLYTADFLGAFCKVDVSVTPPRVTKVADLSGGLAVSGDLVGVANGTLYATAYRLSDGSGMGTQLDNLLITIDPANGNTTVLGSTGFPKLFGTAFALGQVFGFTHDQTGRVVTIDPRNGRGTIFNTFMDPSTSMPISFAGAGVNAMVNPIP